MISFVIPTLNEAKTIEQTLQCVAGFSGAHELIVSDGNSTDETLAICRRYADQVVVHEASTRQTIGMARNMGAAVAKGDYLVFLDADVVIPDIDAFFETALAEFRARPGLVALTCKYRVFPDVSTWGDRYVFAMLGVQFFLQNNVVRIGAAGGEFQLIATSAFTAVGGFDERLTASEDMDLFRRLSRTGRTRFINGLKVFHTGRRAHEMGWPKLLWSWFANTISVWVLRKSASKEWKPIR